MGAKLWLEESERKYIAAERQLAKLVVYAYEKDPDSVPDEFKLAVADVITARETEAEARKNYNDKPWEH
jgi:hypothetical protein